MYPATPVLSVAVNAVTCTVSPVAGAVTLKAVTDGAVVSLLPELLSLLPPPPQAKRIDMIDKMAKKDK
jgi:hypothetical protein